MVLGRLSSEEGLHSQRRLDPPPLTAYPLQMLVGAEGTFLKHVAPPPLNTTHRGRPPRLL